MAQFLGLGSVLTDLLDEIIKIVVNFTTFFAKTTLKGFIKFLMDTLRYFEMFIDHVEHLIKR